jgi:hypothetical protein
MTLILSWALDIIVSYAFAPQTPKIRIAGFPDG